MSRMVAKYHGRNYTMDSLRQKSGINREGVSLSRLCGMMRPRRSASRR
ncbi:MAG: hypothetical protein EA390_14405 [Balneolaceae bacterium]|nr:MAG: hypothetical protein EA390_14405 [Balneolaceae bacterium]